MDKRRCSCGKQFNPQSWSQKRCNTCRFAPSSNPLRRLDEKDIPVIRTRYASGETAGRIARDYGVARSTVYAVVVRQTWRHIA